MTTEAKNHIDEKIRRQLSARGIDEPTDGYSAEFDHRFRCKMIIDSDLI